MNDDAALLRRYADEKSEAAFAELVRRHLDLVYSAALRRLGGDAHRAADIAQQVFTTLARDTRKLSRHAVLTAWLYTATRNAAIDLIRSEQRRHTREQEATAMQNLFSASPDADWERLRPVLDEVMDELSDADRTAVLLRFFEKRAFSEVGAVLHLSEDAARMRVERALDKMHILLRRRGVTSTASALGVALTQQAGAASPAGLAASVTGAALGTVADAGVFAGVLAFMTATKSTVVLGVVAALAIVTALYQTQQAHAAVAALESGRNLNASLRSEWANLDAQAQAAKTAAASNKTTGPDAAAAAAAALEKQKADNQALQQLLNSDPQLQQLRKDQDRSTWVREWLPLFLSKGLTAEQIEQAADEYARRAALKIPAHDSTRAPLTGFPEALVDDERFARASKNWDTRILVENFASRLYNADSPVTSPQVEQLIKSIQDARPDPMPKDGWGVFAVGRTVDWDRVIAEAGGYLTPAQLSALRGVAAWGRWQAQVYSAKQIKQ